MHLSETRHKKNHIIPFQERLQVVVISVLDVARDDTVQNRKDPQRLQTKKDWKIGLENRCRLGVVSDRRANNNLRGGNQQQSLSTGSTECRFVRDRILRGI